jgi:hypothetical protein
MVMVRMVMVRMVMAVSERARAVEKRYLARL